MVIAAMKLKDTYSLEGMSRISVFDYQADEQASVVRTSRRISSRIAGRCHAAQLSIIKQMSRQVS